jgi:serine protease
MKYYRSLKCQLFIVLYCITMTNATYAQKHTPNQILVQYSTSGGVSKFHFVKTRLISPNLNIWLCDFDASENEDAILKQVRASLGVVAAQFYYVDFKASIPNDPNFGDQWHLKNMGTAGADIHATSAWDITKGGRTTDGDSIVIAIIDDGTELNHPDLIHNNWVNKAEIPNNGIDDDGNGFIDDYLGWNGTNSSGNIGVSTYHGLGIGGLVGAEGNNNIGVSGVNWHIKSMNLTSDGTDASVFACYDYALTQRKLYNETEGAKGAFVVASNSSFGRIGTAASAPLWCNFFDSLGHVGILNFGATANAPFNVDQNPDLPSDCGSDYLVIVTATTNQDALYANAAFGPIHVDIGAPGYNLYTTALNGSYIGGFNGTSFATPIVTGIAALLYSSPCSDLTNFAKTNPSAAALLMKDYIMRGVDLIPDLNGKVKSNGRANAYNSLLRAMSFCQGCGINQVAGFKLKGRTSQSIQVSWTSNAANVGTLARYRVSGTTIWTDLGFQSSPLTIPNLQACTPYDVQIQRVNDTLCYSTWFGRTYKTDGCCEPTKTIKISQVTNTGFLVSWSKVLAASGYRLCLRDSTTGACRLQQDLTDTLFQFSSLTPCTNYKLSIKSRCGAMPDTIINIYTKGCGSCLDSTYCESRGQNGQLEWINSVRLGSTTNTSGKNGGYANFTNLNINLEQGRTYTLALTPAWDNTPYNESIRVWIDYNQDTQFDNATDLILDIPRTNQIPTPSTITIPINAKIGQTKMRVTMKYIGTASTVYPTPCEQFPNGEVEDYCVNITGYSATKEVDQEIMVTVNPNPAQSEATIRVAENNTIEQIALTDCQGKVLINNPVNADYYKINELQNFANGVYFLKIQTFKGLTVRKLTLIH